MSTVKANTILPDDPTQDITLGASGDTVSVAADSIDTNTVKDKGGNILWSSDGAGNLSNQAAAIGSSNLKLLDTNTVSNQAASAFTSNIDSTYDTYIIEFININPATNGTSFTFQVSTDGGSSYGKSIQSTLTQSYNLGGSQAKQYQAGDDQVSGTTYVNLTSPNLGNESDRGGSGQFYIFKPSSSTTSIFCGAQTSWFGDDAASEFFMAAMVIGTVGPVDAINFKMASGNLSGIFKLYGLL